MRHIESTSLPIARRKSWWPWFVVGLLGTHVAAMAIAVTLATRDRSFAVVPDYYQRAVNWDQAQAQIRASEKLGWRIAVEASDQVDPLGRRVASFVFTDARGSALPRATLEVEYFHHAHGDDDHMVKLSPDAADPTHFTALLPMRYAGQWEFHFTGQSGGQTFVAKQLQTLSNARRVGT